MSITFEDVVKVHTFNSLYFQNPHNKRRYFEDDETIKNVACENEEMREKIIELLKTDLCRQMIKLDMEENIDKAIVLKLKERNLKNIPKNRKIILKENPELDWNEKDLPYMLHLIRTNIINKKDKYEERLEQQLVEDKIICDEDDYMEEEAREKRKNDLDNLIKSPVNVYLKDQLETYLLPHMSWTNLFLAMRLYKDDVWAIYRNQYYSVVCNNWSSKPYKVFDLLYYYNNAEKLDRGGTKCFMLSTNYDQFKSLFDETAVRDTKTKAKNYEIIFK